MTKNKIIQNRHSPDYPIAHVPSRTRYFKFFSLFQFRSYTGTNSSSSNTTGQDVYNRYSASQQSASYSSGVPVTRSAYSTTTQGHSINTQQLQGSTQQTPPQSQPTPSTTYPCSQDYYRQEQVC